MLFFVLPLLSCNMNILWCWQSIFFDHLIMVFWNFLDMNFQENTNKSHWLQIRQHFVRLIPDINLYLELKIVVTILLRCNNLIIEKDFWIEHTFKIASYANNSSVDMLCVLIFLWYSKFISNQSNSITWIVRD